MLKMFLIVKKKQFKPIFYSKKDNMNEKINNNNISNCYLKNLKYEIDMFYILAKEISINEIFKLDTLESLVTKNAFIESFLVHERNIIDFLINNRKYDDNIVCKDLLENEKELFNKSEVDKMKEIKVKISKEISHLTKARCKDEKSGWNMSDITCPLLEYFEKFINELSTELDYNKKDILEKIKNEVLDLEKLCESGLIRQDLSTTNVETLAQVYLLQSKEVEN